MDFIPKHFKNEEERLLSKIKFHEKFQEVTDPSNHPVLISKKYKSLSTLTKQELVEIVKICETHLLSTKADKASFKHNNQRYDVVVCRDKRGQQYYKIYTEETREDAYLASGGGGRITKSLDITSNARTVEKQSHGGPTPGFKNEIDIQGLVNYLIRYRSKELATKYPDAFVVNANNTPKCRVLVSDFKFYDLNAGRTHMKRYVGGDLLSYLEKNRDNLTENLKQIATDMILASAILNDLEIIHRDKKLLNYFIDENGRVALGDFGESFSLEDLPEDLSTFVLNMGTAQYNSKEIAQQLKNDVERNDHESFKKNLIRMENYALGACLYELFTHTEAYDNDISKADKHNFGGEVFAAFPLREDVFTNPNFQEKVPRELQPFLILLLQGGEIDLKDFYNSIKAYRD